jgi:hypothetical protein
MIIPLTNGVDESLSLFQDKRGEELGKEANKARDRMLRWKEADFLSIFGPPVLRVDAMANAVFPGGGFARLSVEPKAVGLSGLRTLHSTDLTSPGAVFDPKLDKDHTDLYDIGSMGRIEVFFGRTGLPQYIAFFMSTDAGFTLLNDEGSIEKRLVWERPRFEAMVKEIDSRWDRRVVWKVDRERQRSQLQGLNSVDPSELWQALSEWSELRKYYRTSQQSSGRESILWYDGSHVIAEASRFEDKSGSTVDFRYRGPDGVSVRRTHGKYISGITSWRRADDTVIRGDSSSLSGAKELQLPDSWTWFNQEGQPIRREFDSNGDGLPDKLWQTGMAEDSSIPLAIDRAWIINPSLIPESSQIPSQDLHRLPIRKAIE